MKRVFIKYEWGNIIGFKAEKLFYKNEYGFKMIGYLPEGKKRKTWHIIDGYHDSNNDYTKTKVTIEEI